MYACESSVYKPVNVIHLPAYECSEHQPVNVAHVRLPVNVAQHV